MTTNEVHDKILEICPFLKYFGGGLFGMGNHLIIMIDGRYIFLPQGFTKTASGQIVSSKQNGRMSRSWKDDIKIHLLSKKLIPQLYETNRKYKEFFAKDKKKEIEKDFK